MFVKPADGLKVRDPIKKDHLPPEGREVDEGDIYWARRLRDGDVVKANAVRGAQAAAAPPAAAAVAGQTSEGSAKA